MTELLLAEIPFIFRNKINYLMAEELEVMRELEEDFYFQVLDMVEVVFLKMYKL